MAQESISLPAALGPSTLQGQARVPQPRSRPVVGLGFSFRCGHSMLWLSLQHPHTSSSNHVSDFKQRSKRSYSVATTSWKWAEENLTQAQTCSRAILF
eukprot:297627-Amphidinium_carterae.1